MQTSCTRYREVSEDNDENHIIFYKKYNDAIFHFNHNSCLHVWRIAILSKYIFMNIDEEDKLLKSL